MIDRKKYDGHTPFNEAKLRDEIVRIWGPAGAHTDLFDSILAKIADAPKILKQRDELAKALHDLYDATPDNEGGKLGVACMKARRALGLSPNTDPAPTERADDEPTGDRQ